MIDFELFRSQLKFAYKPSTIFTADETFTFGREPIIRPMPDGSIACLIFTGGETEPRNENIVAITNSYDRGLNWTKPKVIFRHKTRGVWATEIFTEGKRPCVFVHTFDATSHYLEIRAHRSFSADNGKNWSEPISLSGNVNNVSIRQGIVLKNGTWIFPVYWQEVLSGFDWDKESKPAIGNDQGLWQFFCGVIRSNDCGKTFSAHGNIRADTHLWEPNIVELESNHLLMYIRANEGGYLYKSESFDGGLSWSEPGSSNIPNAGTKISLVKIGDAVIMLHNPNSEYRNPLSLWVSKDNCKTWNTKLDIAWSDIPTRQICYPHAFADENEKILYVAIDTRWEFYLLKIPFADFL